MKWLRFFTHLIIFYFIKPLCFTLFVLIAPFIFITFVYFPEVSDAILMESLSMALKISLFISLFYGFIKAGFFSPFPSEFE
jgi:hypothetical protein